MNQKPIEKYRYRKVSKDRPSDRAEVCKCKWGLPNQACLLQDLSQNI